METAAPGLEDLHLRLDALQAALHDGATDAAAHALRSYDAELRARLPGLHPGRDGTALGDALDALLQRQCALQARMQRLREEAAAGLETLGRARRASGAYRLAATEPPA